MTYDKYNKYNKYNYNKYNYNKDIEMIYNPHLWPAYPILPMVRRVQGQLPECAIIIAGGGTKLYHTNMYMEGKDEVITAFDSFEAILDAGWEID